MISVDSLTCSLPMKESQYSQMLTEVLKVFLESFKPKRILFTDLHLPLKGERIVAISWSPGACYIVVI